MDDKRCIGVDRLLNVGEHQEHYVLENNHSTVISKSDLKRYKKKNGWLKG
ncbi:hypothetical protein AAZR19_17565 [Bacillus sp. Je.9.29.b]